MSSWETPDGALALAYAGHAESLRGVVRHELVLRAITGRCPQPVRVLDIGGGSAHGARMLARRGYEVTVIDPDPAMHAHAIEQLTLEEPAVRSRVRLVEGSGEDAVKLAGSGWPLVCCHGVLMYLEDPGPLLAAVVAATTPGGTVSVLTKNAAAIPLRPALEGRWGEALAAFDTDREVGNLGVTSRGHDYSDLAGRLAALGAPVVEWHGVRVVTDHLRDAAATAPDRDLAIELEWELGRRDPYRACGRLLHLLAQRTTP